LDGSASGGNGTQGYTYSWTPAGSVSDATIATPTTTTQGTYTLLVTDVESGCTASDTVTVTQDARAPVANAGVDGAITCNAPLVSLTGVGSGGNGTQGYTFAWSPATGVIDPTAASTQAFQPGTYTLT